MALGDLAFYAGIVGIVIYLCLMATKHAGRAGKLTEAIQKYTETSAELQHRLAELESKRDEQAPVVDDLLAKVVELRGVRDQLQIQYEDMQAKVRGKEINVRKASRGRE